MKCIKEKCQHYQDHTFFPSYFECDICLFASKKKYDTDCMIDEVVKKYEEAHANLIKQSEIIKKLQS